MILGSLPKSQMPDVLSAADISTSLFIPIPEMEANSANKFFDGLSSGCCMAINYGGWQASLLRDYGAGIQLSRDVQAASCQLRDLADFPGRIAEAGRNARRLAELRFSRDSLILKLEQVLNQVIN